MKKVIKLSENDLRRIITRIIKENEEDWISQSQDIEGESDFSQMEKLKDIEEFQELVDIFKNDKELADYYRKRLGMNVNESYKYYDYGDNKKEITKSHYRKRKLATYTVATLASAIVGYMMGTMAEDQVLQAALLMAGMGGFTFGSLASEVGREKVKDDEQITEMEDEEFMRGADRNWREREDEDYGTMRGRYFDDEEDDEEWGETDRGEQNLQDLLEEARDILENELGYSIDAINEMDEYDIVDDLHAHFYNELAYEIEHLLEKEGFADEDEPYDSIGGHSVKDLERAFSKTKSKDEELQDLIEEARDFLENECGYDLHDINLMSEEDIVDALYDEENDELAEEIESLLHQEGFDNMPSYKTKWNMPKDSEEELDEGWDDFIQKKRYPKKYKPENYINIPKGFLRKHSGRMIDPEGTILTKSDEDPFDEYTDFDDEEYA